MTHPTKKMYIGMVDGKSFFMKNKILYIQLMPTEIFKYESRYHIHIYLEGVSNHTRYW